MSPRRKSGLGTVFACEPGLTAEEVRRAREPNNEMRRAMPRIETPRPKRKVED